MAIKQLGFALVLWRMENYSYHSSWFGRGGLHSRNYPPKWTTLHISHHLHLTFSQFCYITGEMEDCSFFSNLKYMHRQCFHGDHCLNFRSFKMSFKNKAEVDDLVQKYECFAIGWIPINYIDKNGSSDTKLILYHFLCLINGSFTPKSFTFYLLVKIKESNLKGLCIVFWTWVEKCWTLQRKGNWIMLKGNPAASSVLANCM